MDKVGLVALQAQLPAVLQMAQLAFATARGIVAAIKAANPGADLPDDAELIRVLSAHSEEGVAEADALLARLRAQL